MKLIKNLLIRDNEALKNSNEKLQDENKKLNEEIQDLKRQIVKLALCNKTSNEKHIYSLPCELGTPIWKVFVNSIGFLKEEECWISEYRVYQRTFELSDLNDFGKTVFLSCEDVKEALNKIKNKFDFNDNEQEYEFNDFEYSEILKIN